MVKGNLQCRCGKQHDWELSWMCDGSVWSLHLTCNHCGATFELGQAARYDCKVSDFVSINYPGYYEEEK